MRLAPNRIGRPARLWLVAAATLVVGAAAAGQDGEGPENVPLDRLLKLPQASGAGPVETRGGSTRGEWLARFERARADLEAARSALDATRSQIEKKAGEESAWRMGAPGLGGAGASAAEAPLDYKLTQELRRNREEMERAERQLQDLEVEANLAGVPPEWRGAPQAAPATAPVTDAAPAAR